MDSTFATVVIKAVDQTAAQTDFNGLFTAAFTDNPEQPSVATHYVSSGYFYNTELDFIVNEATWPKTVRFGDAAQALTDLGLQSVVEEPTLEV